MRKKMRRTYPRKQGMEYKHGGNKMLKLSLKQGQYVNIGDNIRVVYVGGSGNHARLLIDAPRELNIARSTTEENPARKRETYYSEFKTDQELNLSFKLSASFFASAFIRSFHRILLISCCASLEMPGSA